MITTLLLLLQMESLLFQVFLFIILRFSHTEQSLFLLTFVICKPDTECAKETFFFSFLGHVLQIPVFFVFMHCTLLRLLSSPSAVLLFYFLPEEGKSARNVLSSHMKEAGKSCILCSFWQTSDGRVKNC